MSRDDRRRTAALNLATGSGDATDQEVLQRSKTKLIRIRIAIILGSLVIGGFIGLTFGRHGSVTSGIPMIAPWRTAAGPALIIVGVILELVVIVVRVRSGGFKAGWRSPSLALSRGQRTRLLRQIRGRADVDRSMLPVSRQLAELLRRQRSMIGLFIALPLVFLGQALPHNTPIRWWLALVMIVVYSALGIQVLRDFSRATVFLQRHPLPPPPADIDPTARQDRR